MLKNWKIFVLWGAAVWVIMFVVVFVLKFTPGIKNILWLQWVIEWIVSAALGYLIVGKILKSYGGKLKEGLLYGVTLMVVSLILDAGITVPTFIEGKYGEFFGNWVMWVGILLFLVTSAAVGQMNKGGTTPQAPEQPSTPQTPEQTV